MNSESRGVGARGICQIYKTPQSILGCAYKMGGEIIEQCREVR